MNIQEFQKLSTEDRTRVFDSLSSEEKRILSVKGALVLLQTDAKRLAQYFEQHDPTEDQFLGVCSLAAVFNDVAEGIDPTK